MSYLIGTEKMFIGAILQNNPCNTEDLENSFFREWRITIQKTILKMQVFSRLYILLEI